MKDEDLIALLTVLATSGIGDILAKRLLAHFGSAYAVLEATDHQLIAVEGIGKHVLKSFRNPENKVKAMSEFRFIQTNGVRALHFQEEAYPDRLKQCLDAPVLLFTKGNWDVLDKKVISIVGTRKITPQGADFCSKLIADLVPFDPVIVSGFAYGVDIHAHLTAIQNKVQTIGVLAHGLNQIYPKPHQKHTKDVIANGGFITEFWSTSKPDKENFVKRNRIVAGIAEATIVIESAEKGGSMITAHIANDYNRDVFAVPGRTTDTYSQGCNKLIKINKANLLTDVSDLVYVLNWDIQSKKDIKIQPSTPLDSQEKLIYDYLATHGKSMIDTIAVGCDMPTFKVSSVLITLELKNQIRPLPGKLFELI